MPQGTLLDPLVFLTYISDIQNVCHNIDIDIMLFADDTKCWINVVARATSPALKPHASVIDLQRRAFYTVSQKTSHIWLAITLTHVNGV